MSQAEAATIAVKQCIPAHLRYTIKQFNADFPDDDTCLEFIKEMRWPKGIAFCKKCKTDKQFYRISGRRRPPAGDPKKKCVIGLVERKGRVLALAGNDATRESLHGIAKERILPESTIFTDEYVSYDGLDGENDYIHRRINHAAGVYVV